MTTCPIYNGTDRPKIRLRGSLFFYTPRPIAVAATDTDGQTVTLIYRGHTFDRPVRTPTPYQQPRAINWRWQ